MTRRFIRSLAVVPGVRQVARAHDMFCKRTRWFVGQNRGARPVVPDRARWHTTTDGRILQHRTNAAGTVDLASTWGLLTFEMR